MYSHLLLHFFPFLEHCLHRTAMSNITYCNIWNGHGRIKTKHHEWNTCLCSRYIITMYNCTHMIDSWDQTLANICTWVESLGIKVSNTDLDKIRLVFSCNTLSTYYTIYKFSVIQGYFHLLLQIPKGLVALKFLLIISFMFIT